MADTNTSTGQLQAFCDSMKDYHSALNANLKDPTSELPMFMDSIPNVNNYQLITDANAQQSSGVSPTIGALVDAAHGAGAVQREYGMRIKTKADYFNDAIGDTDSDSNFYDAYKASYNSLISGTSPDLQ